MPPESPPSAFLTLARPPGCRRRSHQAPSGVRSPSRPSGRKTRMAIRIPKTIDRVQSLPGAFQLEALVESLDEPDQKRTEHGAAQVPDAAEDGRRERDQPQLEPGVVAHVELQEEEEARGAGERAGEDERERDRPVHVDAHHRGRIGVLRGRPHGLPLAGRLDQIGQADEHGNGDQDDHKLVPRNIDAPDREGSGARDQVARGPKPDAVDSEADVLDDERHADGGDERSQARSLPHPAIREELDRCVQDRPEQPSR